MTYDDWRETYSKHGMFNDAMASAAWDAAIAAERERCATICEEHAADKSPPFKDYEDTYLNGWLDASNECGWAIRGPNGEIDRSATGEK